MIVLDRDGDVTQNIVVTVTEKSTLDAPHYLFVFEHTEATEVVKMIKSHSNDLSDYTYRYNEWVVNISLFEDKPLGFWNYTIYEQDNDSNLDPNSTIGIVEVGRLLLIGDEQIQTREYNKVIEAIVYER